MRKGNKVAQLNRRAAHRRSMMANMATSLFEHERIVTTRARGKVLRSYAEKLITRARQNLGDGVKSEDKLHNKRMVMRTIKNEDIVAKLFTDIAARFKDRNGGYVRLVHMPARLSDASEMSVVELVDRKEKARRTRTKEAPASTRKSRTVRKEDSSSAQSSSQSPSQSKKKDDKTPWYKRFRKNKGPEV